MLVEILILGVLCAGWALYGLWGRRFDPDGFREPGRCGGCREGECRKRCQQAVLLLVALAGLSGCSRPSAEFRTFTYGTMATKLVVTVPDRPSAEADAEAVAEVFRGVDARMSEWKDTSPLSGVNRSAGLAPAPVPADLREVIRRGIGLGELTGGAFDITWAALWGLWDFKAEDPAVPDREEIARRVRLVDYRRIVVDDDAGTVFLPEAGMLIGLGGIAKGYALDRAAAALRELGFRDFLLLGGGQVYAGGTRGGRPWRVGIRDPRGGPEDYFATLQVTNASVSTSGDYERYFILEGARYHHILDPRSGMPARGLRSATVVSADATLADALSTALLVLGAEAGMPVVEALEGVDAVLVDEAGEVIVSSGIGDRLLIQRQPRAEAGEDP